METHDHPPTAIAVVAVRTLGRSSSSAVVLAVFAMMAFSPFASAFVQSPRHIVSPRQSATRHSAALKREAAPPLFALTAEQEHAREVFEDVKGDDDVIRPSELGVMLRMLDIDASDEDAEALFRYLDKDDNGSINFEEFLPWYDEAADAAKQSASVFQGIIQSRRTVHKFDKTPVADDVLQRAVQCAIAAPNRRMTEPWGFINVGPETVQKLSDLNKEMGGDEGSFTKWTNIPGWCVVTTKITPDDPQIEQEDFKSTCCAVQNFMLSMWSEGIGTKWTSGPVQRTPEFAKLCGVDTTKDKVAGVIWYGFASGGLVNADPKQRERGVDDVLTSVP